MRALEDLLIADCVYAGLLRGKLDQQNRCAGAGVGAGCSWMLAAPSCSCPEECRCCCPATSNAAPPFTLSRLPALPCLPRCLHVEGAFSRDVRPDQLGAVAASLGEWLAAANGVLAGIEQRVDWCAPACLPLLLAASWCLHCWPPSACCCCCTAAMAATACN